MANFKTKIICYLEANSKTWEAEADNIILQDDRIDGVATPYIKTWNVSGLVEPTDEQLNNLESTANNKEALTAILSTRKNTYPSLNDFAEAYCEKEIGGDSTKWDSYVTKYNKVRTDNPKE